MLFILSNSYGVLLESSNLPAFHTFLMAGLQPQAMYRRMAQCFLGIRRSCLFCPYAVSFPRGFSSLYLVFTSKSQHLPSLIDSACRHLGPVKILCGQQELAPTLFIPGMRRNTYSSCFNTMGVTSAHYTLILGGCSQRENKNRTGERSPRRLVGKQH